MPFKIKLSIDKSQDFIILLFGQIAKLIILLSGIVLLSRILTPSDFGIAATAAIFLVFADVIRDFGTSIAVMKSRHLSLQDQSNLFWINFLICGFFGILFFTLGPLFSVLLNQPKLTLILRIYCVYLLVGAWQNQIRTQLVVNKKYTFLVGTEILSQFLSLALTIFFALRGYGFLSLVYQQLSYLFLTTLMQFWLCRWTPSLPKNFRMTRLHLGISSNLGIGQVLAFVSDNIDTILISRKFGSFSVGLYSRAYQLSTIAITSIINPLTQWVIPKARHYKDFVISVPFFIRLQTFLMMPITFICVTLASTGNVLIPYILGNKWQGTGSLLQILALGTVFQCFSRIWLWALIIFERSSTILRLTILSKAVLIIGLIIGNLFSVQGVAIGYAIGQVANFSFTFIVLRKTLKSHSREILINAVIIMSFGAIAYIASHYTLFSDIESLLLELAFSIVLSLLTFFIGIIIMPSFRRITIAEVKKFLH